MYDLLIYDTSNFTDFPIGGQLTSIRNFLKYVAICKKDFAPKILLIGVTTKNDEVGRIGSVEIDGVHFDFLPVLYRNGDLSNVQKSLRLEYLKALFWQRRKIVCKKQTVHFIHTPEAFIAVKLMHPTAKTAVFSHGSFFNMVRGFRFFQKNKLVHFLFERFIILLLKSADLIFVLDEATKNQYLKYSDKVCRAENSIVLPENVEVREECYSPIRLLFVGRLSKVKRVDEIILAVERMKESVHLTIVGDGEERNTLEKLIETKHLEASVSVLGSLPPAEIGNQYREHDILIMNSVLEGKPMTILEAMSYGLPVITTPVGGIPEMVNEGCNAEFTDGTQTQIVLKVEKIKSRYNIYAEEVVQSIQIYDFQLVNSDIMKKLEEMIRD